MWPLRSAAGQLNQQSHGEKLQSAGRQLSAPSERLKRGWIPVLYHFVPAPGTSKFIQCRLACTNDQRYTFWWTCLPISRGCYGSILLRSHFSSVVAPIYVCNTPIKVAIRQCSSEPASRPSDLPTCTSLHVPGSSRTPPPLTAVTPQRLNSILRVCRRMPSLRLRLGCAKQERNWERASELFHKMVVQNRLPIKPFSWDQLTTACEKGKHWEQVPCPAAQIDGQGTLRSTAVF